tara:strand:- start:1595 stop:2215 length:621 start_codon:yes stop_codon:yes gene_type:complete
MEEKWSHSQETDHAAANDSGSDMNDETLRSPPDKDFSAEPPSVIAVIAVSLFVGSGTLFFGVAGIVTMLFSITNPNHEDGGLVGVVCFGIPLSLVGLFCFLLYWASLSRERLRVQHSRDRLVFQATIWGLGLFSEKRRLSEAVYLETDKDGRNAVIYGRSSEGVEWELDMSGVVTELADAENPSNPPYQKWAREIAKAVGIDFRME